MNARLTMLLLGLAVLPVLAAPSAEEILDRHVQATGGEVYKTITSRRTMAELRPEKAPENAPPLQMTVVEKAPDKRLEIIQHRDRILARVGYDGETAWQQSGDRAPRALDGAEAEQIAFNSILFPLARWREVFDKVEMIDLQKIAGRDCYVLRLVPKAGPDRHYFFDAESYQLLGRVQSRVVGDRRVEMKWRYEDYRDRQGISVPFRIKMDVPPFEHGATLRIVNVTFNGKVADATFAPPGGRD